MELNHLIQLISELPTNHKCKYVRGEEYCTFLEVDPIEPRVKSLTPTGDEHSVSGSYLEKLAENIKEFEPFNISQLMNNSGSNRPVIESIVAHTAEFYWLQKDRAKYVVWVPSKPHSKGQLIQWPDNESIEDVARQYYMMNYLNGGNNSIQTIYYGCPGTGKSYTIKMISEGKENEKVIKYEDGSNNIFRTTFHPDYDYATFVGSYKPLKNENNELDYQFTPQVFTNAYVQALKHADDPIYLIIEEINRGNCAQIFGDLFQLLDRTGGVSDYGIKPDSELSKFLKKQGVEHRELKLPKNFHIYATMNTSDQSLFPMDSAFKRRWAMEYMPINYTHEIASKFTIEVAGKKYLWIKFLEMVNERIIDATDSEDKQMGEFFIKHSISEREFINKVMFYLWNDVCKDLYNPRHVQGAFFLKVVDKIPSEKRDYFTFAELFSDRNKGSRLLTEFFKYLLKKHQENHPDFTFEAIES